MSKTKSNKANLTKSMRSVASGGSAARSTTGGADARAEASAALATEYAIFRGRELPHETVCPMNSELAAPPAKRDKTLGKSTENTATGNSSA